MCQTDIRAVTLGTRWRGPKNVQCVQMRLLLLTSDVRDQSIYRTRFPYFGRGFAAA